MGKVPGHGEADMSDGVDMNEKPQGEGEEKKAWFVEVQRRHRECSGRCWGAGGTCARRLHWVAPGEGVVVDREKEYL